MKKSGAIFGIIFIIVGILGFFSNPLIGPTGFFAADAMHSVIHLILGAALLIAARSEPGSRKTILTVSVIYLILSIAGFFQFGAANDSGKLLGMALANSADNWLHLVLAAALGFSAIVLGAKPEAPLKPVHRHA